MMAETVAQPGRNPAMSDADVNDANASDADVSYADGEAVYDDGHLRVEHDNYYVSVGGRVLKLPRKEFLILSRLARKPARIVASEELWQHAWGRRAPFNAESMHVHIYRLRRKLEPHGLRIETMVNVGYCLLPTDEAINNGSTSMS